MGGASLAASVLAYALACGCAPHEGTGTIGSSSAPGGGSLAVPTSDGGAPRGAASSPIPSDFRTAMTHVNGARFLSRGHAGGRWDADVYADQAAATTLAGAPGAATVSPGQRFVEEHFERGDGGAGPIMMMEKRPPGFDPEHGDWRYVVVGSRGDVVKDGKVESCAGCHGDAPGDHVFRVESSAP